MVRLVEFASWVLFILLGVAFLAEGWGSRLSIPYLLLLFLAIFLRFSIRVVKEYERLELCCAWDAASAPRGQVLSRVFPSWTQ